MVSTVTTEGAERTGIRYGGSGQAYKCHSLCPHFTGQNQFTQPLLNFKGSLETWPSVSPERGGKLVCIWPIIATIQALEIVAVASEAILTPKKICNSDSLY